MTKIQFCPRAKKKKTNENSSRWSKLRDRQTHVIQNQWNWLTQKPSQFATCVCCSFNGQQTYEFQWNTPIGGFFGTSNTKNPNVNFVTHAWHHKSTWIPLNRLALTKVEAYNGARSFYYEWDIKSERKGKKNDNNTNTDTNGQLNKLFCVTAFKAYLTWDTRNVNIWRNGW